MVKRPKNRGERWQQVRGHSVKTPPKISYLNGGQKLVNFRMKIGR